MDAGDVETEVQVLAKTPASIARRDPGWSPPRSGRRASRAACRPAGGPLALRWRGGSSPGPAARGPRPRRERSFRGWPAAAVPRAAHGSGERAALVAEQLAFEQAVGEAAQFIDTNRRRAGGCGRGCARPRALCRSRLPGNEDRRLALRDPLQIVPDRRIDLLPPISPSRASIAAAAPWRGRRGAPESRQRRTEATSASRSSGSRSSP